MNLLPLTVCYFCWKSTRDLRQRTEPEVWSSLSLSLCMCFSLWHFPPTRLVFCQPFIVICLVVVRSKVMRCFFSPWLLFLTWMCRTILLLASRFCQKSNSADELKQLQLLFSSYSPKFLSFLLIRSSWSKREREKRLEIATAFSMWKKNTHRILHSPFLRATNWMREDSYTSVDAFSKSN